MYDTISLAWDFFVKKDKEKIIMDKLRFIDLFAGIGGIRKGFELACADYGIKTECVFTSEIKPYAIDVLKQNTDAEKFPGDMYDKIRI